mgnify:CR=1 FL=1
MKIAILGSGGREHALANQIKKSKKTDKIYCIPGNAGTSAIGAVSYTHLTLPTSG